MSFINPAILLGVIAATVPIIIHLINLQKKQSMFFSSFRLLFEIQQTSARNFKIRQWMLAVLRSLIVLMLVFAFSKPVIDAKDKVSSSIFADENTSIFLIVDATPSMNYQPEYAISIWVAAKKAALKVLESKKESDEIFLSITGNYDESILPITLAEVKTKILRAETVPLSSSLEERIKIAAQTLKSSKYKQKEIVVISDFHSKGFYSETELKNDLYPGILVFIIRVDPENKQNIAIENIQMLTKIVEPNKPVKLSANVWNFSEEEKEINAKLFLNGKLSAERTVLIPTNERNEIIFNAIPTQMGFIKAEVKIGEDALPQDNNYFFSFFIPPKIKVLLVHNKQENAEYFRLSLNSFSDSSFFEMSLAQERTIDAKDFTNYDYIIFSDASNLSDNTSKKIKNMLSQGGGVLISIPPDLPNYDSYNRFFADIGAGRVVNTIAFKTTIEQIETKSEIFQNMFSNQKDSESKEKIIPDFLGITKMVEYVPASSEVAIVRTTFGSPLFSFLSRENAKVTIATTTMLPSMTDFVFQPIFSPMLFKVIFVSVNKTKEKQTEFVIGKPSELILSHTTSTRLIQKVIKPSGETFIPFMKNLAGERRLIVDPVLFNEIGTYEVIGEDGKSLSVLSINSNLNESEVKSVSEDSLKVAIQKQIRTKDVFCVNAYANPDEAKNVFEYGGRAANLWKAIVALVILCLCSEIVLGRKVEA